MLPLMQQKYIEATCQIVITYEIVKKLRVLQTNRNQLYLSTHTLERSRDNTPLYKL